MRGITLASFKSSPGLLVENIVVIPTVVGDQQTFAPLRLVFHLPFKSVP